MKLLTTAFSILAIASGGAALAAGDLSRANPIEVVLEMGTNDDGMYFSPNNFTFETGQAYKWLLVNVDDIKHELALHDMGERIFTRKIQVLDADGETITEVKGSIREVEVGPGQTVEWWFVPIQTTFESDISCEIEGHREAGMFGTATLK